MPLQLRSLMHACFWHLAACSGCLECNSEGGVASAAKCRLHMLQTQANKAQRIVGQTKKAAGIANAQTRSGMCANGQIALDFEARRVLDWISYHNLMGVDCFVLHVDMEHTHLEDAQQNEIYKQLISSPLVIVLETNVTSGYDRGFTSELDSRLKPKYMADLDLDEFLFLEAEGASGRPMSGPPDLMSWLDDVFGATGQPQGMYLHRWNFGTNGYKSPPPLEDAPEFALLTERMGGEKRKLVLSGDYPIKDTGKLIYNLGAYDKATKPFQDSCGVHKYKPLEDGSIWILPNGQHCPRQHLDELAPNNCFICNASSLQPVLPLSINHYVTGSLDECRAKVDKAFSVRGRNYRECVQFHPGEEEYMNFSAYHGFVQDDGMVKYANATRANRANLFPVRLASLASWAQVDSMLMQNASALPLPGEALLLNALQQGGVQIVDVDVQQEEQSWKAVWILGVTVLIALCPILVKEGVFPFMTVVSYLACLSLVKMYVKEVLELGWEFPDTITAVHMLCTAIFAAAFERPKLSEAFMVLPISAVNGASLLLNNQALMYAGVAFISMVSACTPMFTFSFEIARGRRALEWQSAWPVAVVCLGATFCIHGEKAGSAFGLLLAAGGTAFRAMKSVWQHELLKINVSPMRLLFWNGAWSFCVSMAMLLPTEGLKGLQTFPATDPKIKTSFFCSICVACVLNCSQCYAVKQLGALMQSVAGNLNLILVIVLSQAWLHEQVTIWQYLGVALLVSGAVFSKILEKAKAGKQEKETEKAALTASSNPSETYNSTATAAPAEAVLKSAPAAS